MGRAVTATSSDATSDVGTMAILVLLTVIVPVGCVLWFLGAAIDNQQLAVTQRLTDVYRSQFDARKNGIAAHWKNVAEKLEEARVLDSTQQIYKMLITGELCGAIVVYDDAGEVIYPRQLTPTPISATNPETWRLARSLEADDKHQIAADTYSELALAEQNLHSAARAMQAQIRCLVRAGKTDAAISVITGPLSQPEYRNALDSQGRVIAPQTQLLALQIGGKGLTPDVSTRLTDALFERIWDDSDMIMPATQRLFLVDAMRAIRPDGGSVKPDSDAAMRAYRLGYAQIHAETYLDEGGGRASTELLATGINDIWSIGSYDSKIVALFTDSQMKGAVKDVCESLPKLRGAGITVRYNPTGKDEPNAFLSEPIGKEMPGWRISLFLRKPDPFQAAADRQRLIYIITAAVAIGMILLIAIAITRHTRRETKLTQLKNDLMGAVSNELKTPTESMPVLIDNFHVFSQMACDQCAFEFVQLQIADLVDQALESAGRRFSGTHAYLKIDIEPDLPPIAGDSDALVTVIMNLLDNAWKYSRDNREIRIKAIARGKFVCLKVIDNGIGMAPRVVRRIFGRFYQAAHTPASSGRCGLGLHIAKSIIDAHGGAIEVVSHPSVGSTFIVKLPILRNAVSAT